MSGSVNKVILVGKLGRDPEVRFTSDGSKIVNISLATSDKWKDRATGERKERTEWHKIIIFNERLADIAEKYLRKGSECYVEGALQTRKWTDQSGVEKYTTEIVLQKFKGELTLLGGGQRNDDQGGYDQGQQQSQSGGGEFPNDGLSNNYNDLDDDIPFITRWSMI